MYDLYEACGYDLGKVIGYEHFRRKHFPDSASSPDDSAHIVKLKTFDASVDASSPFESWRVLRHTLHYADPTALLCLQGRYLEDTPGFAEV